MSLHVRVRSTASPVRGLLALACVLGMGSAVATAGAASPPSVYTGEAAELTPSSTTLKGSIYPGGQQETFYFQYGQSTAYGAQTSPAPLGSTTQTIHVSVLLSGLAPYTAYHYRLVAATPAGMIEGQDRTFTTRKIPLTFTLAATPNRDLFESPFSVAGTLSGTGSANHAVVLQANPFPYLTGFRAIGNAELTDAGGGFSFSVPGFSQNTELRVATVETPPAVSAAILERVAVRVVLHVRPAEREGYVRLYGRVTPAEFGALVDFQLLRPGRAPATVAGTVITAGGGAFSRFSRVVRIRRPGLYRAQVYVASGAQVSNHSHPVLVG